MNTHNTTRQKKPASRRRVQNHKKAAYKQGGPHVSITRSPFLVAERSVQTLRWTGAYDIKNVGFKDASYVLRPSSIYDVDPAIGGASVYGLGEFSKFYSKYRVRSSKIRLHISNTDLEGGTVFVTPSTLNPGNNMSDIGPYLSNPLAKYRTIGGYQADSSGVLTHFATTRQMAGVSTLAEDGYTALVTTNPVENWYWVIGFVKAGVSNQVNGVAIIIEVDITVDFFDRKVLESTLSRVHRRDNDPSVFPAPIPVYLTSPPPQQAAPAPAVQLSPYALSPSHQRGAQMAATPQV